MVDRSRVGLLVAALVVALLAAGVLSRLDGKGAAPSGSGPADTAVPAARQPIPRRPAALARVLTGNTRALYAAIDRWRSEGDPSRGAPPEDVTLRALYHQRIHMLLSVRLRLASRTIALLPRSVADEARDLVAARRALGRLAPPPSRRRWRTGPALPAGVLLRYYGEAHRRFGVSRAVLAAVNLVESGFNRLRNRSVAGARGPMQFLPGTWARYGLGGDVEDPHDAVMGAANYLRASGAPRSYRRALYAYNPSPLYVNAVLRYARQVRRDLRTYYVLYSWQVFVRTPSGIRRITGPRPR
jgi:soluble lytic murein transglycosylase-like protein